MMSRVIAGILVGAALCSGAVPVHAQEGGPLKPVRGFAGGGIAIASTVGEFSDYVGTGWGLDAHFLLALGRQSILGLRADVGFINYGNEKKRVCLSQTVGCRIEVDLTTSNNIFTGSIGPQLTLPAGPVMPYANASIGFAYFATTSSVGGVNSASEDFQTTNFDDATFSWQFGTGLRVPVHSGRTPIDLDFGARYHANGQVEYLTKGGISDQPDGSITLNPILSEANLWTFVIGAAFGVRW
jgi:opacity protein-like surface antigen